MDEIEPKIVLSTETKNKETEIYNALINKLYKFFVIDEKEAKLDSVITLLSVIKKDIDDDNAEVIKPTVNEEELV